MGEWNVCFLVRGKRLNLIYSLSVSLSIPLSCYGRRRRNGSLTGPRCMSFLMSSWCNRGFRNSPSDTYTPLSERPSLPMCYGPKGYPEVSQSQIVVKPCKSGLASPAYFGWQRVKEECPPSPWRRWAKVTFSWWGVRFDTSLPKLSLLVLIFCCYCCCCF